MREQARFRTDLFRPLTEDSDQEECGRELADWLCANLPKDFGAVSHWEDWGYAISFDKSKISPLVTLCCGHVEDDQWTFFCSIHRSFTDKIFRRHHPRSLMEPVIRAVDALIASDSRFTDVEWFDNDKQLREINPGLRAFE